MTFLRNRTSRLTTIFSSGVLAVALGVPAEAAIMNGDFGSGLNGWETIGDVGVTGGGSALLTTEPAVPNNGFAGFELDGFLGVTIAPFTFTSGPLAIEEGSGLKQSFSANAGEVLSFEWNFLTSEDPLFGNDDGAYIALLNTDTSTSSISLLSSVFDPAVSAPGTEGFDFQSGLSVFSTGPLSAGNYVIGFAIVDDFDPLGRSGLLIDNVQLGTVSQQIPEPSTVLGNLIAIAAGGYLTYRRKRKRAVSK